ncbi:hypothetical protein LCC91_07905 [Tepidimonas taiwanensis]|uniref:Uncharacterized protein n=1 Tax=Tepidimonas taiwanensis TaxID=307486 RepID=A0A554XAV3_9BURK|nr:hypothetical protein [Tepidimonas taiwanensis]TSE32967.1 hypothetical protein Ttaiw_00828 [Tepidimonas taiwanensis]UBQ04499.1 hypothetical protein LCC91_07905 [Tepidimonas taiwanensis]
MAGRTKPKRRRQKPRVIRSYTPWHELMASPTEPLPLEWRTHHLTRMWQGLVALETAPQPTTDDWRVCSDAVNMLETLIARGPWLACTGDMVDVHDTTGLLNDAIAALAMAGRRSLEGKPIRLDGAGIQAVRAVLESYADALEALSARAMVRCHRLTEQRIAEILAGKRLPHDVEVMDL